MIPTVVSFGCPRSGTTFLHHCLCGLSDGAASVLKLTESNGLHPAQSRTGLWELARLFRGNRLALVRIVRRPADIAESFLAARQAALRVSMPGLARNSDGDIARWVREESTSVMCQRPMVAEEPHVLFVEVRYESLADDRARRGLVADLGRTPIEDSAALDRVLERLRAFGTGPVRKGRLSEGLGRISTDEEREYFDTRLATITKREGYAE